MDMSNPFAAIAQAITGGQPPAAQPGQQAGPWGPGTSLIGTPLDLLLGPSERLHQERLQQTGANDRLASTQAEARRKEDTEQQAAQELAGAYQTALSNSGGDRNQALRSVMASPAFVRAFSHGSVDKLVSILKGDRDLNTPQAPIVVQTPQGGRTELLDPQNPTQPGRVIENPREAAPDRAIQTQRAEALRKISDDGQAATAELSTLNQLGQSLDRVATVYPSGTWSGLAAQYGLPVTGRTDLQVVQSLIARLTPAQRQGLPGAASDKDVAMFRDSLPSLMKTPQGNKQILETLTALAEARVNSGRLAGSAFSGSDPSKVWGDLQNLRSPLQALEERRHAEDERVLGFSRREITTATKAELVDLANRYRGNAVAEALIRRRAGEITAREREILGR